jgi:hypothetical protein
MKNLYNFIILSVILGCFVNAANAQENCNNVALNRTATASSTSSSEETTNKAFDGDLTTNWSASAHYGWIQVDLQNKVTVDSLKLYVNQFYSGNTVHEIKVSEDMENWILADTLTRYTYNNQVITVNFNPALSDVRGVMINTTSSNSWIAWYEIEVFANPYIPTIIKDGYVLTSSSATNNQWYLNGSPIPDANFQSYTASASGSYQVGISYGNDCESMSEILNITDFTSAINKNSKKDIRIYPNPAKDIVIIEGVSKAKIEVFNLQGQAVKHMNVSESKNSLDISALTNGLYSIKITTAEGTFVKKLLKE